MSVVYAIFVLSLFVLAYVFHQNRRGRRLPPGPWQIPILGYLPWIDPLKPYETFTKLARTYGPIYGLRMGSVYTVILSEPRLIKQAFAKDACAGRAPLYLTHGMMQGYGLVCAEGEIWREQRKFVATCLRNFGMVKYGNKRDKMEKRIVDAVDECIWKLRDRSKDEPIDPLETLHHCMGNYVNSIVFGKVYEENDAIWKWLRELQEEGVKEIGVSGPLNFLPFLRFLPRYGGTMRFLLEGKRKTHQVYRDILEEYRARSRSPDVEVEENFLAAFDNEMNKSSETSGAFTEPQLYHLLADLSGAGIDTTLTTLRWFLLYMAAYPEEQKKIQEHMDRLLPGNRELSLEDRAALPYLEAAIAEVQRLRSVAPLGIPHGTMEDTRIDDYDVPKGAMVISLQWAVHTDPAYWEEPLRFRPERFLAEDGSLFKPEAFIPFQTGKRICVGEELAKMILFLFAGRILRSLSISIPPGESIDLEGECGITLVPKPHRLLFTERGGGR